LNLASLSSKIRTFAKTTGFFYIRVLYLWAKYRLSTMNDVLIMSVIMSVPIVAILAGTLTKIKRMELEKGKSTNEPQLHQLEQRVALLAKENQELKHRVENLETIVTLSDVNLTNHLTEQPPQALPFPGQNPLSNLGKKDSKPSGEIAKIIQERRK